MRRAARAGELLEKLLKGFGLDLRLQQYRALVIWDDVVGPQIAAHARPHKIRGSVLEVCVDQPAWMQQLQLMKPQILKKLNTQLGEAEIKEIFLKKGKLPPPMEEEPTAPPAWKKVNLDREEKARIHGIVAAIEDPELRQRLEMMLSKQARLLKTRDAGHGNLDA
jgi:hypothetical protein